MPPDFENHILISQVLSTYSAPSSAAEKIALFAPDSTLVVHGGVEYKGKFTIEAFFAASENTKKAGHPFPHHLSSIKIDTNSSDHASAVSYFLVMGNTAPDHWGVYRDELVRIGGEWVFKERRITIEGADPKGWIGSGAGPVKF
ncbi:hypothetical protein BU16DRAFT_525010 [Lophium mytilinum]|uniref:SnoaL-like domain-containing protein n=1 Tax=Lophium mytilinum TaxID=390894 RepID=A0A6A6QYW5_9PEZI|nr:hypothetical protein BU16DRAFT_525010 [Lophium mytilinum]